MRPQLPSAVAIRRVLVPVAIVSVLGAGVVLIAPTVKGKAMASTTATITSVKTTGFPSGTGVPGIFTDRCGYSHSAPDDPVLAPGRPGASMHHDFYGNTATSAASTAATLVGGRTTCSTSADASAYWTPALYQDGRALTPGQALIYWRRGPRDTGAVRTIPAGLQMIAGDEAATGPQPLGVVRWTCTGTGADRRPTTQPHDCSGTDRVRLIVQFPSCWDGHTLAGADQHDVVYPDGASCPADHPVRIPQVVFHVAYPTSSAAGLTVSMTPTMQGSTDTEHVDFVNGWTQAILDRDVAACVATSTRCGPVKGAEADPAGPAPGRPAREKAMTSRKADRQADRIQRMQKRMQRMQGRTPGGTASGGTASGG